MQRRQPVQIDNEILQAVAVCAELTGTTLTEPAMRLFASDLSGYPRASVLRALERCRRELKYRLTLADVLTRIEEQDGRPSADEAWAMLPMTEEVSVAWTAEMAAAWGVARAILDTDRTAARMAFRSAYDRAVVDARREDIPIRWSPSLGLEKGGRDFAMEETSRLNALSHDQAKVITQRPTPKLEGPRP